MKKIRLPRLLCLKCGYTWVPRQERRPGMCPGCKTSVWDRPRKEDKRDEVKT